MRKNFAFIFISIIVAIIGILLLPDEDVPIHWGLDGNVDGYGSKYFILIFPAMTMLVWIAALLETKVVAKDEVNIKQYVTIIALILFLFLQILFLCLTFINLSSEKGYISKYIISGAVSLVEIIFAVLMKKVNRNKLFGVRTKWSLYNDITWEKTNKIVAILLFVAGLATLIIPFFTEKPLLYVILIVLCVSIVSIFISYLFYKRERGTEYRK